MYTLIIHHLESDWESEYNNSNTSLSIECVKVLRFLKKFKKIKQLIITKNNDSFFDVEYYDIYDYCNNHNINFRIIKYGYGWLKDESFTESNLNITWCYATRPYYNEKDILLIPEWFHKIKDQNIIIGGSFKHACILDLKDVLNALNVKYKEIEALIVK